MDSKIYISEQLIQGHIEEENLDLNNFPKWSDIKDICDKIKNNHMQRLLGVVTRCESYDNYVFILTNQFGVNDSTTPTKPTQIYLDKKQWTDSISLEEGMWVTFELRKQSKKSRHAAINARSLSLVIEDYNVCKNYLEIYTTIDGNVNGFHIEKSIKALIQSRFLEDSSFRQIILEDLYNRNCNNIIEWTNLLSNFSTEEISIFDFDTKYIDVTLELRILLYKLNKKIELLKDINVISALTSADFDEQISILISEDTFLSEEDKNEWIEYVLNHEIISDKLRSILYILSVNSTILASVQNRENFISLISHSREGIIKLINSYIENKDNPDLFAILSEIDDNTILDSLLKIDIDKCIQYLLCLPVNKAARFISDNRCSSVSIKNKLLTSEYGLTILIEDLYLKKSENVKDWDAVLSEIVKKSVTFVFDETRLKPTAELRICLYKYLNSIEWLLDSCVISFALRQENQDKMQEIIDCFTNDDDLNTWLKNVSQSSISNESLLTKLFYLTNNIHLYTSIQDKSQIITYYNDTNAKEVSDFLKFAFKELTDPELHWIYESLDIDKFNSGLKKLPKDTCLQLINRLPENVGVQIVTSEYFRNTNVFSNFIKEKWDTLKSEIQYIVFDLESDGETIHEFAFCSEDNLRSYTGEDQIKSLIRNLKKKPIIVGHNIKQWDLPILYKKGLKLLESTFIWDTLEMEILLNPCRYAYSLHTQHKAEADTILTNELFWNQLYRLSSDEQLVESLKEVLPSDIKDILSSLQIDYFLDYFRQTANLGQQFFQELRPLSDKTMECLEEIARIPSNEETLIIAPQNIWARLAQYIPLSFPTEKNSLLSIDIQKLYDFPIVDIIQRTILERFCIVSKTPLVCNLAQYLTAEGDEKISFTDKFLEPYLSIFDSHIDCIDVSGFECQNVLNTNYKHIFTIGTELDDRIHKCQACDNKSFADLLACGSKLPFTMASTNYAPIKDNEIKKLGITMPKLAANVWVEREKNGQFTFWLNYQYQSYRANFLSHFKVKPKNKKWEFVGPNHDQINLTQVSRIKMADTIMRVSNATTQRSKYWLFQFALIGKIHATHPNKPIIYIVNDKDEINNLIEYATSLGYYIPINGSGFRKLQYIGNRSNGMIIITKQEFIKEIGSYRTNNAYCYIWDNMDIDRYMLMWDKLPFEDDLEEDIDAERDDKVHHTTPRQCIHAAWPIYEHYTSLVMANNKETQCFIIDPYFDDYEDIANSCQAKIYKVDLWESNDLYTEALNNSSNYFNDSRVGENEIDTTTAMDLIRKTFIDGFDWKETQKEVLPHMIEKRGDCIISMPTGEGKSVCFQGPAIFKSSINRKLSLVITPLRALMQDQVEKLQKQGFATNVDYLSRDRQRPEVENIYRKIRSGELALLFITPERFRTKSFINVLYQRMEMDGGLEYVIFDEAHCISQWGQDFRPDYRNAIIKCKELREQYNFMFAMFSATVTTQVESDIRTFLPEIQRLGQNADDYNPIRQHIGISFNHVSHEDNARIAEIVEFIETQKIDFSKSCMIIFCRTHRQCEEVAESLNEYTLRAKQDSILLKCTDRIGFYHAGLDADLRNDVYEQFKRVKGVEPLYILCATKAFGMGMDIPNVHYVVHYNPPSVLEDYLQEVGRAGRDEEMYKKSFLDGEQIPALCLTSNDDFKKLKELLVKSQMSWSNLTDAKEKIVEYITRFQTLEQTKLSPIVVPFDIWIKNEEILNDTTSSRLAFHWLEKIGCIKQLYFSPAHIDITIKKRDVNSKAYSQPVYRFIIDNTKEERCLISINDIRSNLRMSMPKIMNSLIELMSNDYIEINETIRCNLVPRRYCEARYMIKHSVNQFALRVVFQGLRNLLFECKKNVIRFIGQKEREEIFKHLMDDVEYTLIEENGKKYMPWKKEEINPPKMAVLLFDTFKKNIITRMGAQMFSILYYLPMVSYKINHQEDEVICQIRVKDDSWNNYLNELESDCLKMIKFVVENTGPFNWAQTIIDFGWTFRSRKGYRYFEDVLSILHHLAYIDYSALLKNGIEILATDTTSLPIEDGIDEKSIMFDYRKDFDNQEQIKKIRLACMNIFSLIKKGDQADFIRRYFQSRNYEDYLSLAGDYASEDSDILSEVSEEALKIEEKKLENNPEQKAIYEQPKNTNVNVLAGPGAGKTHVLTLRCARLIYKEHIDPSHILVLAYNRAVVVELRNRLNTLFTKLGMSRIAHQLHVYTFHALAKKCLGQSLDSVSTEMWEVTFLNYLKRNSTDFIAHFRNLEFILVDEFQDITLSRLAALDYIHKIFKNAKFFTIGDINQSIYGFDRIPRDNFGRKINLLPDKYAEVLKPQPYYEKWTNIIKPKQLSMFTNYRSYQKILDKASMFLTEGTVPRSADSLMQYEPKEPYVIEIDNNIEHNRQWFVELPSIINWAIEENKIAANIEDKRQREHRHIGTIAVFFRTNNEVYRGYSKIKNMVPTGTRIRIQGESIGEVWREREIYYLIKTLQQFPNQNIILKNDKTLNGIKSFLIKKMKESSTWDSFLLDVAYCLVLNYIDSIRSDSETHTYLELADYIKDIASRDDAGQVYKIYENYKTERILQEPILNIVLTTMHKVKGLEFDVVITTPSFASLPLRIHHEYGDNETPWSDDLADMEEERRLMYVAYTRAKKRLFIFKSNREHALDNNMIYPAPNISALRYTEVDPGLDKYYLSFSAKDKLFEQIESYISNHVKKDDAVVVYKDQYENFCIKHNGRLIGRLAKNSTIAKRAIGENIRELSDFYISSIFVWTYEDTIASDERSQKDYQDNPSKYNYKTPKLFALDWSEKAKKQGYIHIVQIAGFGKPLNNNSNGTN